MLPDEAAAPKADSPDNEEAFDVAACKSDNSLSALKTIFIDVMLYAT